MELWRIEDLKVNCRPEFIGHMKYSGGDGEYIHNMAATALVMHSITILVNDSLAACGTIHLESGSYIPVIVDFRSGVFGRMYIVKWPGEQTTYIMYPLQAKMIKLC